MSRYDEKALKAAIDTYCKATGVVMVPVEPTDEMCLAGYEAERSYGMCDNKRELARQECEYVYRAMIRAAFTHEGF